MCVTMALVFKHPFTMIVAGPSGSGKTVFTKNLINNLDRLCDKPIDKILWCYTEENALRIRNCIKESQRNKITYHKGLPTSFDNDHDKPMLIILDDLMMEATNEKICEVFTRGSHHRNQSIVLIVSARILFCTSITLTYMFTFSDAKHIF